ncbi:hypothetical protein BU16DRAFT_605922 [Lophium mytilinum]|uniref:K Homology domain-containing protein n=1 Tax=Lophium mytilinum TaxID=390894 RepID=A0A6A6QZN1_9PEZI|nr:hypothetical protein BU16DRAFT_605922 [Lophium mytilinum]
MAAQQPDISAILAALGTRSVFHPTRPAGTSSQPPPQGLPPPGYGIQTPTPPVLQYGLPQPMNSGSLDLSAIKPVSTGSVSLQDALAKARGFAAEKGLQYDSGRNSSGPRDDPRLASRSYLRSRSRSRSPPRQNNLRDSYNPYRDDRREDPRRGGIGYSRDRSRSPPRGGRDTFSPPRAYGGRRSPPVNDNVETIVIESSLVGLVIGRSGENLRRIEEETGTRIQFVTGPEAGGPQRQCKITGNPRARVDAKREINRIIEENGGNPAREAQGARGARASSKTHQPALREGENSVQIMVPDRTVGLIIGRGGETIRDLQERSGCHVNIVGENKSVNGLRPVNLIGTPQASARAKELILEIVDSDTKTLTQQQEGGRRDNFDQFANSNAPAAAGGKVNDTIMVPSDAVGMIIGKGGETIKEMQNTSGCKINVSQASGADIEREIGLVGTRQAIEDAKKAIWEKVDSVKEKNGGGYGGGGNNNRRPPPRDNGNYGDPYSQPQQQQPYGQVQHASQPPPPANSMVPPPQGAAGGEDPYAVWGGYQNYAAYWYAAMAAGAQQQGQTPGQGEQK